MSVAIDFTDKHILITGGTQGIGWGIAKACARAGAQVYLTYKWGSADQTELKREMVAAGCKVPICIEADVADDASTADALTTIKQRCDYLDAFVSNVAFAPQIASLDDYKKKSFFKTVEYSSWPLISYVQQIYKIFGRYPASILGISSDGPDHFYKGYDFVSASKALLEHFARYLSIHLLQHGCRVNVIRYGTVKTHSFDAIFGEAFFDFLKDNGGDLRHVLSPEQCGTAALALLSDLTVGLNGQVITFDYGTPYKDNLMMRYLSQLDTAKQ